MRSTKPAIFQVSAYYPPHLGGQENVVQSLSTALAKAGERVQVITSDLGARAGTVVESSVTVHRLRSSELAHTAIIWKLLFWLVKHVGKHDVVHLHAGQVFTPEIVWLASKIKGFRYVLELHIDFKQSSSAGMLLPLYKKYLMGLPLRGAQTVAVLNKEHQQIVQSYGCTDVRVVSNGIDEDFFITKRTPRKPQQPLHLLFVGRLSPQKNLPMLMDALRHHKDISLSVVGEGEDRPAIEAAIKRNKLKNVTLLGQQKRVTVVGLYKTCDTLVLPSLYEAQPLVLLEAMAARIPIMATNVQGIAEHIRGIGVIAEPTAEGLDAALTELVERTPQQLEALTAKGYAKAKRLRWEALLPGYLAMYEGKL